MEVTYNTKFLLRRGTAEAWERNNPILAYGEPGYDSTNYGLKIGDGKTNWRNLEFLSASKEQIEEAINKYFEENPNAGGSGTPGKDGKDGISVTHRWNGTVLVVTSASGTSSANLKGEKGEPGLDYVLTEADKNEIAEIAANLVDVPSGGDSGSVDLSLYYTKKETDEVIQNAIEAIDLETYATESWVSENYQPKGEYLTQVPAGYATEDYVKNKIAEASLSGGNVDLSGYATKEEIPTKVSQLENDSGYLTEHQDISGKLDASALPEAINTALIQAKVSGDFDGEDGEDGATFTPTVDLDGNLSWTNNKGLSNPSIVNIKGPKGDTGSQGIPGEQGQQGEQGISITHEWSGATLIVTSASGTSSANLKGEKGDQGEPGVGVKGESGYTPVKGIDYWTPEDKTAMVSEVLAALPVWTGGSY